MRTERPIKLAPSQGVWLFVVLLILGAVALRVGLPEPASTPGVPPDAEALDLEISPISPEGKVSQDDAMRAVREANGTQFDDAEIDAYLVHLTDRTTFVQDRDVWLFAVSGLSITAPCPMLADGTCANPETLTRAYVYVDADTGEWLISRLWAE
jgi:hypothetical protein